MSCGPAGPVLPAQLRGRAANARTGTLPAGTLPARGQGLPQPSTEGLSAVGLCLSLPPRRGCGCPRRELCSGGRPRAGPHRLTPAPRPRRDLLAPGEPSQRVAPRFLASLHSKLRFLLSRFRLVPDLGNGKARGALQSPLPVPTLLPFAPAGGRRSSRVGPAPGAGIDPGSVAFIPWRCLSSVSSPAAALPQQGLVPSAAAPLIRSPDYPRSWN